MTNGIDHHPGKASGQKHPSVVKASTRQVISTKPIQGSPKTASDKSKSSHPAK